MKRILLGRAVAVALTLYAAGNSAFCCTNSPSDHIAANVLGVKAEPGSKNGDVEVVLEYKESSFAKQLKRTSFPVCAESLSSIGLPYLIQSLRPDNTKLTGFKLCLKPKPCIEMVEPLRKRGES